MAQYSSGADKQGLNLLNGSLRGVVAPKGLPRDVEAKLIDAFQNAGKDPAFIAAMNATANPVELVTGEKFKELTDELYDLAKQTWESTPWN